MLVGLAAYAVLAGADFGAGLLAAASAAAASATARCASTPTTRWAPSGRPTTSG